VTQALWRLLLICAAAAAGETIAYQLEAYSVAMWVGLVFGAAAYILTQDLDRPRRGGGRRGEIKYWRGRRIDENDDTPRQ
jgi:hypothetical protein